MIAQQTSRNHRRICSFQKNKKKTRKKHEIGECCSARDYTQLFLLTVMFVYF